jgi:hypothetical protein
MISSIRGMGVVLILLSSCGDSTVVSTKYPLGITLKEAKERMSRDYKVHEAGIKYRSDSTKEEYERAREFMVIVEDENLVLFFNHFEKLIAIELKKGPSK